MNNNVYEAFLDFLWKTSRNKIGNFIWKGVYALSFSISKHYLLLFSGAEHVFAKGSYAKGNYQPLISDLDFVLVFRAEDVRRGRRRTSRLMKINPLVKDADCFTEESFFLRLKYGSMKYESVEVWKKLDKKNFQAPRREDHPLKKQFDLLQEIYFYTEWINFNLDREPLRDYRLACAKRSLLRCLDLLEAHNVRPRKELRKECLSAKNRAAILKALTAMIETAADSLRVVERFSSLGDYDRDEVLSRPYFQERFFIIDQGFQEADFKNGALHLSSKAFDALYVAGILDSKLLFDRVIPMEDKEFSSLLAVEYLLNIEEGRYNSLHTSVAQDVRERLEESLAYLEKFKNDDVPVKGRMEFSWEPGEFKEKLTYHAHFLIESTSKLDEDVSLRFADCCSDDVRFRPYHVQGNLWSLGGNFYSFKDFSGPKISVALRNQVFAKITLKKFNLSSIKESISLEWKHVSENKGRASGSADRLILDLEGSFADVWHKVVVKLSGVKSKYTVRLKDDGGGDMASPRIQEKPDDYLTLFFHPGCHMTKIQVEIAAPCGSPFDFEAVCFRSR